MKKLLLWIGMAVGAILLGLGVYAAYLLRSINTPEFQRSLLARVKTALGADVKVGKIDVSLLSGVTLDDVTVANPRPFAGTLLTADAFVFRYRWRSLLAGRLEVERLVLDGPVLNLAIDEAGRFNYERLGRTRTAAAAAPSTASGVKVVSPVELVMRRLAVRDARIVMRGPGNELLMKMEGVGLDAAFQVAATGSQGSGTAAIAALSLADTLFVRGISAPVLISKESLKVAPMRGELAGGAVTADAKVNLKDGFDYSANLEVRDADVRKLLQEAGSSQAITGKLQAKAAFTGSGGLPTLKGLGEAEIADCEVSDVKALSMLSTVLKLPELANPTFDKCAVEFRLAGNRVQTPVLTLEGADMQLTGDGAVNLASATLDYRMTLALRQPLLNKITARELRAAFEDRGDGFSTINFKVWGPTQAPKTDLTARVAKAAVTEAVAKGLSRLFGKKKQP